jgi:hypothetical protein
VWVRKSVLGCMRGVAERRICHRACQWGHEQRLALQLRRILQRIRRPGPTDSRHPALTL